jgi:isocitrate lyase
MLYDNTPPRPPEYGNGKSTEYRGFIITDRFEVKGFGEFISIQQAKNMIDASLAMKKLQDKGAALKKFVSLGVCQTDAERFEEQVNNHFENELYESANRL